MKENLSNKGLNLCMKMFESTQQFLKLLKEIQLLMKKLKEENITKDEIVLL